MSSLSVIIITKNEAANIRACLESVKWADEIIVVDSNSTDDTVAICREYTSHVYSHDWPGFGPQKNRALNYASKDWVLSLDADERLTLELRSEIEAVVAANNSVDGYDIPRLSSFCGRYMRHSGWYPDYVTRLFKKESGKFTDDLVHERVVIDGEVARLKHHLLHESFRSLDQLLNKMNYYSAAGAAMMASKKRRATLGHAVFHGVWAFFRSYVIRAGFLDGAEGFMLAVSTAEGTYYRYVKRFIAQKEEEAKVLNIVEPTLANDAGHCASFIHALCDANTGGGPFRIWASRGANIVLPTDSVEIQRYFHRRLRKIQSYFLYRKLLRLPSKIFISTASRADMMMLSWASSGEIPKGKVSLYFHWFNPTSVKLQLLKRLASQQPNLTIFGPTASVTDIFKDAGFSQVRVVPYPITPQKTKARDVAPEFKYLLYAGAARQDKGFSYLIEFIELLQKSTAKIPVVIQTSPEHFGKYDAVTLSDIERLKNISYPYLSMKTEVLSAAEYAGQFSGAVAIQLYKQSDFTDRVSGVTLDAFSNACPVISTADTWIARTAERFDAGVCVESATPEGVLKAAEKIIAEYPRYAANARNAGQTLQQENSASVLYNELTHD